MQLQKITIDNAQVANSRTGQGTGKHRAQRPTTTQRDMAGQQLALPLQANTREDCLPTVPIRNGMLFTDPRPLIFC
jgi:hypothetical protein